MWFSVHVLGAAAVLTFAIEGWQGFIGRSGDPVDVAHNSAGTLLGVGAALAMQASKRYRAARSLEDRLRRSAPSSAPLSRWFASRSHRAVRQSRQKKCTRSSLREETSVASSADPGGPRRAVGPARYGGEGQLAAGAGARCDAGRGAVSGHDDHGFPLLVLLATGVGRLSPVRFPPR